MVVKDKKLFISFVQLNESVETVLIRLAKYTKDYADNLERRGKESGKAWRIFLTLLLPKGNTVSIAFAKKIMKGVKNQMKL